jgi:hypothetical protein
MSTKENHTPFPLLNKDQLDWLSVQSTPVRSWYGTRIYTPPEKAQIKSVALQAVKQIAKIAWMATQYYLIKALASLLWGLVWVVKRVNRTRNRVSGRAHVR